MKLINNLGIAAILGSITLIPTLANAHCQVPCGIYDDHLRVEDMQEDVITLEKAVQQIDKLAGKSDAQSINQIIRWVNNKESHAQEIIETISNYFLTQRVKTSQKDYGERLAKHHAVIIAAMKVKQNTEAKHVKELKTAVNALETYYPGHKHH